MWIRTGRIEPSSDGGARFVRLQPEVLAVQVAGTFATEVYSLAELPHVLETEARYWPTASISLAPEDIVVTQTGAADTTMLDVSVTIRNDGNVDARDVLVTVLTTNGDDLRMLDLDVPRRGSTTLRWSEPMAWQYGAIVAAVENVGPIETGPLRHDESSAESVRAFRIFNRSLAPPEYVKWLREKHATANGY